MKQGPINRHTNTCSREYTWLQRLLRPKSTLSDILRLFMVSIMLNIALLASLFLKNVPISEKIVVLLCSGIGVEFLFAWYLKVTHFPRHTEISMPLFMPSSAKLS